MCSYLHYNLKDLIMNATPTKTVADFVTENIKTAHVFKKYGIDFCCGGGISIEKACIKADVNIDDLLDDLERVENTTSRATDYNNWKLDFLADHIVNVHHQYIEDNIPMLKQYADRVAKVHGDHYHELLEIRELVHEVCGELAAHCKKEELILFPFIRKMVTAQKEETALDNPHFGSVDNPIKMMEDEHEEAGEIFARISKLSNSYTVPPGACNTYRAYYSKLQEFEEDLHEHVHKENNILFPKSLQLEKELRQA